MFGSMFSFAKTKVAADVSVWQAPWHGIIIRGSGSRATPSRKVQGEFLGN